MVLDAFLLNTQDYKVRIKGKVEQSREKNSALHLSVVAIEKEAFRSPSTTVANFTFLFLSITNNLHDVVWFQVFLSNTNMVSSNYFYFIIIICLRTVERSGLTQLSGIQSSYSKHRWQIGFVLYKIYLFSAPQMSWVHESKMTLLEAVGVSVRTNAFRKRLKSIFSSFSYG